MDKPERDIETRDDIDLLIRRFYEKLLNDPEMKPIFVEVAQIDISAHLPIIADFWESILLKTRTYSRNTMKTHLDLHKKFSLTKAHFDLWIKYFTDTIDQLFVGPLADYAKERALSIATVIQIKIDQQAMG